MSLSGFYGQTVTSTNVACQELEAQTSLEAPLVQLNVDGSASAQTIRWVNTDDTNGPTRWAFVSTAQGGGSDAGFDLQLTGYSDDGVNLGYVCNFDRSDGSTLHRGAVYSESTSAGIGYNGTGKAVTQTGNKGTGVTANTITGDITTDSGALASGGEALFQVTNSTVRATDMVVAFHASGGTIGAYLVVVAGIGNGFFNINISNVSAGSLSEALVIRFMVFRAAAAAP